MTDIYFSSLTILNISFLQYKTIDIIYNKTQQRVHRHLIQQEKKMSLLYRLCFDAYHSVFICLSVFLHLISNFKK